MGSELMPAEENKVYVAIGLLQNQVTTLSERFEELRAEVRDEQRKVHDIVDATGEAARNLTRMLDDMRPAWDDYRLKAASLDETRVLAQDYREQRAEKRGEDRFKNWLFGLAASLGGLAAVMLSKLIDWMAARGGR